MPRIFKLDVRAATSRDWIEAVGFELGESADVLRNRDDPLTVVVLARRPGSTSSC